MRKMRKTKKRQKTAEKPTIRVGKMGSTYFLVNEISRQLDKRRIVKVKILKTALLNSEASEIARKIAKETLSELIQLRGHTFILHKSKKN